MLARSFLALLFACLAVMLVMPGGAFAAGTPDTVTSMSIPDPKPTIAGIAIDTSGNLYIADTANNQIIMVDTSVPPNITRFGSGVAGFVPFTNATVFGGAAVIGHAAVKFNAPVGIATDSSGNVYVADTGNHRIHMIVADTIDPITTITTKKIISATSKISTIAGNGFEGFSGDGGSAVGASLNKPTGVAVDASGNIYIADKGNYRIRKTTVGSSISTIAGDGTATKLTVYAIALSPLPTVDLYIADAGNNRILKMTGVQGTPSVFAGNGLAGFSGDGGLASIAQLNQPSSIVTNGDYLYIADTLNSCVRRVSHATNVISTRLGPDRLGLIEVFPAITAPDKFANPVSVAVDAAGTLYVEDTGNNAIQQVFESVSAITTATPPGGSYPTAQSVVLTTRKAATIYYTTDGSAPIVDSVPTATSLPYTVPIPISATKTLRFTSIDSVGNQEVTNIAIYTINPAASIVSASPVGGTFAIPQTVTLTSNKSNFTIYYTIDGKSPTTSSTKYSAPLAITKTTTLMFFGVDAAGNRSSVGAETYIIDTVAPVTTASVPSGFYASTQYVTLSTDEKAKTYYTTNGNTPTLTEKDLYGGGSITINASTTLKYFSTDDPAGNRELVKTQVYTIAEITASPLGGTYNVKKTVTLSSVPNVTIYHTIDGKSPTTTSPKYSAPLEITKTTTLMYFAVDGSGNKSAVVTNTYIIDTVTPITKASLAEGSYSSDQVVILTTDDPNTTTFYSIDGSAPTIPYVPKTLIPINAIKTPTTKAVTTTLQYFSIDRVGNKEQITKQVYTIDPVPPNLTVSPVGDPTPTIPKTVTITSDKLNVTIYYTTTGISPTTTSSKYSVPLAIAKTTTLMYFGVDAVGNKSAVGVQTYIIDSVAPITKASPPSGTYSSVQSVTLTTDDPKATIYFTTDGTTPTVASPYTTPILISGPTALKYFAKDVLGNMESVKNEVYTINTLTTSASPKGGLFFTPQTVVLSSNISGATIYYTLDGTTPSADTKVSKTTQKYSKPLLLQGYKTTLKFFSVDALGVVENIKTEEYVINSLKTSVSPKGGVFNSPKAVTLTSSNTGATIYYTLDGTTPSGDAKLSKTTQTYTAPFFLQYGKTTLKFFSLDAQGVSENINTEIYTVDSTAPTATAKCGLTANSIELNARDSNDLIPEILYSTSNSASATETPFIYYTAPITFTLNTIVKFFAVDSVGNVEQMKTASCPTVVAALDIKPALYLETLADGSMTSNGSLYVAGNVDPSATLTINGNAATIATDGSFSHKIQLAIGVNTITTVAKKGTQSSSDTRSIKYVTPGPQAHDPLIAIGTSNGVIGNRVRVPITLKSGYQAATVSIDLDTTAFGGVLSTPTVEIAQRAAAVGKFIQIAPPSEGVYKIVITDINQPTDGVIRRSPLPDGEIAYLTLSIIVSPVSVSKPLTVKHYSVKDLDNNDMAVNALTNGAVNIVLKPGNGWVANAEVPAALKDVLDALYMLLDPVKNPVSGSVDLDGDGRVHVDELQRVINSFIGL